MTVTVLLDQILISPADLEPLCPDFEVAGTFNPGAVRFGDEILLLVRVAEQPRDPGTECLCSPRAVWENGELRWVTDEFIPQGMDNRDPRKFSLPDGRMRLRFISHLRLARLSSDGRHVKEIAILADLLPREPWEELGIEDARITKIGSKYYITYVAVSRRRGVATAMMTTSDFKTFKRHGIIFPTENKDVVLLPEKWKGNFVAYHRPVSDQQVNAPSIEYAQSPDSIFWGRYGFLFGPRPSGWDAVKVGAGPPPVHLPQGWLFIYHGVSDVKAEHPAGRYCVGAVLLDGEDPFKILVRSVNPLLCPDRSYERRGYLPNVIFPTGALLSEDGENLMLFNGGADKVTTLLLIRVSALLEHLSP